MTAETHSNIVKENVIVCKNSLLTGKPGKRNFQGKISIPVLLALLLFVGLSLVILSVDNESESMSQTQESNEATTIALSESVPPAQPLSPQALEDLRVAPVSGLEIQPEPIAPLPLPQQDTEASTDEVPAVAGQEPALPEDEQTPDSDFSLGEALARYLLAMRDDLNREYVENCIQYRSRNGLVEGCPENPAFTAGSNQKEKALVDDLFAIITRKNDYARISRQLERENEALAAILADPANRAASQASIKLALNNSYLGYLNGNQSPAVVMFETMNDFINDYNRTIMSGPVQFRCKDGPCIYEYTGPGTE